MIGTGPDIGSKWQHVTFSYMTITIVSKRYAKNNTRKVVWKCDSSGEIGGCHSYEWFYTDWKPFLRK